jgi:anti-sigma B factor antagonist
LPDIPEFKITASLAGDVQVFEVVGEVDMASAAQFGSALELVFDGRRRVVVDLTQVEFFDSSGVAALIRAHRALSERGIEFRVVAPGSGIVRQVFELTQLDAMLVIVDSRAAALS